MRALAILLVLVVACSKKADEKTMPVIGLQLYSLRNEFKTDVPGTLDKIANMGFTVIEGGDTYGYTPEDFKRMLDDRKLKMVSIGARFDSLEQNIESIITRAKLFGATYLMCSWIPHPSDSFTLEHTQRAVDVFNEAGKKFRENGISFCYHLHGYEFLPHEGGTLFDYLVTQTDPQYVNFEMDVFWVKQGGQNPVALLRKYPQRFLLLHVKDRQPGTPDSNDGRAPDETNVILGTGDVGIADIMKEAKRMGIRYCFIEDESTKALTQIPKSYQFLKTLTD